MVVGTAHWENGKVFNSVLAIDKDGTPRGRYSKTYLAEKWPTPGRKMTLMTLAGVKSSFIICHDVRYPELVRLPAIAGAQICYFPSNESGLLEEHKLSAYRAMPISRATENSIYLVMANAPADADNMRGASQSHGNSKIIHPNGNVLAEAGYFTRNAGGRDHRPEGRRSGDGDTIRGGRVDDQPVAAGRSAAGGGAFVMTQPAAGAVLVWLVAVAAAGAAEAPHFLMAGLRVMPDRWDKEANLRKLDQYARQAAAHGAKLVVTPESFLDGYVGNDKDLNREKYFAVAEPLDGPFMNRVRKLARDLKIYLAVGFPELRGKQVFNSVVMFGPDGSLVTRYSKTHCGTEQYNTEGAEFPVVEMPLARLGTMICLDRQLPETARILAIKGAQVILAPSYGMYERDQRRDDADARVRKQRVRGVCASTAVSDHRPEGHGGRGG